MWILKHSVPWTVFIYEVVCPGAASANLCSHFIRIRSGLMNKFNILLIMLMVL